MVPVTLNNYEAADLSLQSTLKLGAYHFTVASTTDGWLTVYEKQVSPISPLPIPAI